MRLVLLLIIFSLAAARAQMPVIPDGARFIMAHFGGNFGGGDERLYISHSPDGLNWTAINNGLPVYEPPNFSPFNNVLRDPSIIFANGFYWVAYTSGNYGRHASFGLLRSADLLSWTRLGEVSTALPGQTDPITWGPFFYEDGDGSIHLFVSISPIGGAQYNPFPLMRTYEMHPLDAAFSRWSTPVPVQLPTSNTNEFWVWKEGDLYHAVYVDFTESGLPNVHVTSHDLITGWGGRQILGYPSQEGGFVLPKPTGGYRLYLEPGNGNASIIPGYKTCDFDDAFTAATPQVRVTATVPMRNGKPARARGTMSFGAWQAEKLGALPIAERAPTADPDHDGLANLLECALDSDPLAPAPPTVSTFMRSAAGGMFGGVRFRKMGQFGDVTAAGQSTGALGSWAAGVVESVTLMSDGMERVQVRGSLSLAAEPAQFFRVSVSLAAP